MADAGPQAAAVQALQAPKAPEQPAKQAHHTPQLKEGVKVQRFCLTLVGEGRL